jgi:hypothetical protein
MDRNRQGDPGLLLHDCDRAGGNVRPSHSHDITASLRRVEQQRIGKPLPCAKRPSLFKGGELGLSPRVPRPESVGVDLADGVVVAVAQAHGIRQEPPQHLARQVAHSRPGRADLMDVRGHLGARHVVHHAVTVDGAEAIEHDPVAMLG